MTMKRVSFIALSSILANTSANGFAFIQPSLCIQRFKSRSGSIVILPESSTILYATKKNKNRKQGKNRRSNNSNDSGSGFGSNDAKTNTATKTEVPSASVSVSKPSLLAEQEQQPRGIRAIREISTEPLIFTIDEFVSPETCIALKQQTDEEARLNFASLVASELFGGQWGANDGLRFNKSSSSDANNVNDEKSVGFSRFPEGLHVDINNGSIYRSVTLILYLNDVPVECGGATAFPLAGVEDGDLLLEAFTRLLKKGVGHTRGRAPEEGSPSSSNSNNGEYGVLLPSQEADALLLEEQQQTSSRRGVRVAPQAGRLCIFFSRTADGEIDPRSWHAGERLIGQVGDDHTVTEKQILTLFKEVSYGASIQHPEEYDTTSFENYLAPQIAAQREALQALARSHASYFL